MLILEELWSNDLQIEKSYIHNRQYHEALARSDESEKALEKSFSEEQQMLFEVYLAAGMSSQKAKNINLEQAESVFYF